MAIIDNWGPLCQHGLTLIPAWISHIGEYASTHQYPNCRRRSLEIDKMTKADGRRRLLPSTSCCESLQWRHNGCDSVSNHQPYDCFLNLLLRRRSKKISKLRVTGLCAGNSPGTVEFSAQMASNAENVSIWWRHHVTFSSDLIMVSILLLSGVPDFFDRNKILSGYDLSHYQVPHCIRVFFYFVWFVFIHHNFQFYFKLCTYCNILDIYLS